MRKARRSLVRAALIAALVFVGNPGAAEPVAPSDRIDRIDPIPKQLQGVDVRERLGQKLPLEKTFRDQDGNVQPLSRMFDGQHPVLLTLNYSNCPMLCSLQLTGLVKGLKEVEWGINEEYRVVTVSLDPGESIDVTSRTANRYLTQYARPAARAGWRFLTGSEENVRAFAEGIGFSYRYDEGRKEYAHPAAIVLASPDGTIVRYLYGIEYDPKTLRLGLVEASQGKIGTTLDRLVLYCFHYDSSAGRYAPVAQKIMQLGGAVSVVLLAGFVMILHRADSKRKRRLAESTAT